ncbi:hypothetical protein GCM10009736_71010 [Actinomadura bangladeshensis]
MGENRKGANASIFRRRDAAVTGADCEHATVSMLALHLLRSCPAFINTHLLPTVLCPANAAATGPP